ncbi:TetR/AcrR family transcriptional regulator [Antrihabitans sp. YC2-6]|uniref:TetR/AcrR family transcriptional regulator n=1 Tax=Antrihabitans sp. YC2-6 TaxID=2799498 RepID=UPI0018F55B32|nr:TetR/AcrR family transcriptional regulator [Antrihabitans sp. YC2-6]MBJ8345172.1 TetR/AcrR family transcriptional regulator [Antrihabitans sp. YC2-6]
MVTVVTRENYFEAAIGLLSQEGYPGLKQATVCRALKVTTGSFYNYFTNWKDFTDQLLQNWLAERTLQLVALAESEADPYDRLDLLRRVTLTLPHRAEAAIRVWANVDPDVRAAQEAADKERLGVVHHAATQMLGDTPDALLYAKWGVYLLIGFEQFQGEQDLHSLDWSLQQLMEALAARRIDT